MRTIDTTEGPLVTRSVQLAWPAVLQAFLVNFYAFNDYLFIGLHGDAVGTTALSSCFAVLVIQYMVLRIVATGGTTLIAQFTGARKVGEVAQTFREAFSASLVLSLAAAVGALVFMDAIVAVNNVTPRVGESVADYLTIIALGSPAFTAMLVVDGAFRGRGNTRMPLLLETFSLMINTFLNWVLVLGNLGFPALGIEGAAFATATSRAIPGVIGLALIFRGGLGFDPRMPLAAWLPRAPRLRRIVRIGFFDSMGGILWGLVFLVMNRIAGQLGEAAQSGLGAGLRGIEWVAFAFGDGFLAASVTIVGQNIGAKQPRRALRGAWTTALLSAASCQLVAVSFLVFPREMSALVAPDPLALEFAAQYVYIIGWVMWAVGVEMAFYGALIGAGRTDVTLLISGLSNFIRIPLACGLVFGADWIVAGSLWGVLGVGAGPPSTGDFSGIAWAVAISAVLKALAYLGWIATRRGLD